MTDTTELVARLRALKHDGLYSLFQESADRLTAQAQKIERLEYYDDMREKEIDATMPWPKEDIVKLLRSRDLAFNCAQELEKHIASLPKGFREWSAQIDAIEAQTINKCAQIADNHQRGLKNGGAINSCRTIAAAIRALAKKPET
jgi:hypothetical protein